VAVLDVNESGEELAQSVGAIGRTRQRLQEVDDGVEREKGVTPTVRVGRLLQLRILLGAVVELGEHLIESWRYACHVRPMCGGAGIRACEYAATDLSMRRVYL
jgi:hypothetical protein